MPKALRKKEREYLKKVGKRIEALRKSLEMSQDDLAEKIGMDRGTVANLERGKTNSVFATFFRVADALNVSLDVLFDTGRNTNSDICTQIMFELEKHAESNPDLLQRMLAFLRGIPKVKSGK